MASAWGQSWGSAWGAAFGGLLAPERAAPSQEAGSGGGPGATINLSDYLAGLKRKKNQGRGSIPRSPATIASALRIRRQREEELMLICPLDF